MGGRRGQSCGMNPSPTGIWRPLWAQIEATKGLSADPPGSVSIHYGETGFLPGGVHSRRGSSRIKKYVDMLPTFDLEFSGWIPPQSPACPTWSWYDLV